MIQGLGNIASLYSATIRSSAMQRQASAGTASAPADAATISDAARSLLSSSNAERDIQKKVREIESRPAVQRSAEENAYIAKHDARLSGIQAKLKESGFESLSSAEVDYLQKAGGMVNTMSHLSSSERALYDEMVAKGKGQSATALLLIGMSRIGMEGPSVTLPNGKTFDPSNTEVTASSVRNLYQFMFVDPSGQTNKQFEALAAYLDGRAAANQA